MKKNLFYFFIIFSLLGILSFNNSADTAEEKSVVITGFTQNEIEDEGTEFTIQAAYCLKNTKLTAEVYNKKTGQTSNIEIPLVSYDEDTLDAVFQGIIPLKKSEMRVKFKLSNYDIVKPQEIKVDKPIQPTKEEVKLIEEPDNSLLPQMIAEMTEETKKQEIQNQIEQKFQEELEIITSITTAPTNTRGGSAAKAGAKQSKEEQQAEQTAEETVVGVVILLPLLLEAATKFE